MTTTKLALRGLALLGLLFAPWAANAQDAGAPAAAVSEVEDPSAATTSAIEVGVGDQSSDSFRFGKYTGMVDNGAFGIGNVVIRGRDAWNSGGTRYWEVLGTNLGLTSRSVSGKYGNQGLWGVSFLYNELPFYQSDTGYSIFGNVGGASLTLPANLPTNTGPINGLQLLPFLHPQDFSLDRKTVGGGLSFNPGPDWQFTTNVSHEHKDGIKEQSLSVDARTDPVSFPEPVNYDTDTLNASAAYNRKKFQLQLNYLLSNFTDNNAAVLLPSPYLGAASQAVGAVSQWALPPSNNAQDFNLATAYNITPATRVNLNLGYGLQMQNAALLPYTANSNFATSPLPRSSLDGKVQTYFAQVKGTARPVRKLDVSASYTYDRRANDTPRSPYQSLEEPDWQTLLMWSVPYGFTNQTGKLDAGYRISKETKLALGYTYQQMDRTFGDVTKQTDNALRAKLSHHFGFGTPYVSYLYDTRTGSPYQPDAFEVALGNLPSTPPLLPYANNATILGFALEPNYYLFNRFFEADRKRNEVKVGSNFDLAQSLSLELSGRFTDDNYPQSQYGLTQSKAWATDVDLAYNAGKGVDLHTFYTYESMANDETAVASTGITNNTPTSQWAWSSAYQDRIHTVGLGATWRVVGDVFKVGPRYEMSLGSTDINVVSGLGAGTSAQYQSAPVPTISTFSQGFKLLAEYAFRQAASLRLIVDREHLNTKDPALNNGPLPNMTTIFPASATNYGLLLSGDTSGAYDLWVIKTSVVWKF